jgi:hypothetical protein
MGSAARVPRRGAARTVLLALHRGADVAAEAAEPACARGILPSVAHDYTPTALSHTDLIETLPSVTY